MNLIPYSDLCGLFPSAFEVTPDIYRKFTAYADFLVDKNQVMNLTAITDPHGIAEKHFLDSVLPLGLFDVPDGASLVDVGTGAGFPGVPMAIMRPDIRLTLLDSLNKRINFLKELTGLLELPAECIHIRAEDAGRGSLRESFDIATARAVSRLPILCEYCLPLVKTGGAFLAMKGDCQEELEEAKNAISVLGGKVERMEEYALPSGDKRTLVVIRKVKKTPEKYPRGQIKGKAL